MILKYFLSVLIWSWYLKKKIQSMSYLCYLSFEKYCKAKEEKSKAYFPPEFGPVTYMTCSFYILIFYDLN